MSTLLLQIPQQRQAPWRDALEKLMPSLDLAAWPPIDTQVGVDPSAVRYALVWNPPSDLTVQFPALEVIFSLGAGVDHLSELKPGIGAVPVVRMVDEVLAEGMAEYVIYYLLGYHRRFFDYAEQQRQTAWQHLPQVRPAERHVGVLGLGEIGGAIAERLVALGFSVHGWSRREKRIPGVTSHAGNAGFRRIASVCDALVCLLPLTDATRGILDADCFSRMPKGAFLINIGRGGHVIDADLLQAVNRRHLYGAALDVFNDEPLPEDHPFWTHPRISVTPHIASLTNPATAARHVVDNIQRYEASGTKSKSALWPLVTFENGY